MKMLLSRQIHPQTFLSRSNEAGYRGKVLNLWGGGVIFCEVQGRKVYRLELIFHPCEFVHVNSARN